MKTFKVLSKFDLFFNIAYFIMILLVPTLILIFTICDGVVSKLANAGTHEKEQKIMDDIMNDEEYNSLQRPNSDGGPGFTDSGASLVNNVLN